MNQILSMNSEPPKKINNTEHIKSKIELKSIKRANTTSNKADIGKVIRVFSILIILFGVVLIGQSTYALIANREKQKDVVNVSEEKMGKETKIIIETNYPIKSFSYRWNEGEWATVEGNGTVIQIPNGNNILNMTVTDYYGSEHKLHNKQYIYESADAEKPQIEIGRNGNKLRIRAEDNKEMSYITYNWNDEEAIREDVGESNKAVIDINVDVPDGQNRITVIAVDKEGNRETSTEKVLGDTKPTFTATLDGLNLIVSASDDEGISKVAITVDGVTTDSGEEPLNLKTVKTGLQLTEGNHKITITVTNINGLEATENYSI